MLPAKGQLPHDEACRSLRTSPAFGRLPTVLGSQAAVARIPSLSFVCVAIESRFHVLFSESGRGECSSGRNDAPGLRVVGAKLRLHQYFWSQNLTFQSQKATMHPDFRALASTRMRPGNHSPPRAARRAVIHRVKSEYERFDCISDMHKIWVKVQQRM